MFGGRKNESPFQRGRPFINERSSPIKSIFFRFCVYRFAHRSSDHHRRSFAIFRIGSLLLDDRRKRDRALSKNRFSSAQNRHPQLRIGSSRKFVGVYDSNHAEFNLGARIFLREVFLPQMKHRFSQRAQRYPYNSKCKRYRRNLKRNANTD